jgi:hypothetical protein
VGEFNTKVGREERRHKVSVKYSLQKHSNENGLFLVQFAIRNNLYIKSTFPHKTIHMGTWKIPASTGVNKIDCVLVLARHASSIIDVRNSRGANCDSFYNCIPHFIIQHEHAAFKHFLEWPPKKGNCLVLNPSCA